MDPGASVCALPTESTQTPRDVSVSILPLQIIQGKHIETLPGYRVRAGSNGCWGREHRPPSSGGARAEPRATQVPHVRAQSLWKLLPPAPTCSLASSFPLLSCHPWCQPAVWVEWRVGSPLGPLVLFQTRFFCCLLPDRHREGAGLGEGWAFSLTQLGGDASENTPPLPPPA